VRREKQGSKEQGTRFKEQGSEELKAEVSKSLQSKNLQPIKRTGNRKPGS
jgi:hypothetical protein